MCAFCVLLLLCLSLIRVILLRLSVVSIRRICNKVVILIAHPETRQLLHVPHIEALVIAALVEIVLGVH